MTRDIYFCITREEKKNIIYKKKNQFFFLEKEKKKMGLKKLYSLDNKKKSCIHS